MRRIDIYNFTDATQTIDIEGRELKITPNKSAWVPKPKSNIFVLTSLGDLYFPTSADEIFFINSTVGTNLTILEGYLENRSIKPVCFVSGSVKIPAFPLTHISVMIPENSTWFVFDPITNKKMANIKTKKGDTTIIYDGDGKIFSR